jgi:hypothetical protein
VNPICGSHSQSESFSGSNFRYAQPGIAKRPLGDLRLRGKESDFVLYALEKKPDDQTQSR